MFVLPFYNKRMCMKLEKLTFTTEKRFYSRRLSPTKCIRGYV